MRQLFTSSGKLTFGRHKGLTLAQVQVKDPSWTSWARKSVDGWSEAVQALSNPEPKPARRTSAQVAKDAVFKKLTLNERLIATYERVRAREEMDLPPVHGFLDAFTAFDPKTAPY